MIEELRERFIKTQKINHLDLEKKTSSLEALVQDVLLSLNKTFDNDIVDLSKEILDYIYGYRYRMGMTKASEGISGKHDIRLKASWNSLNEATNK